MSAPAISVDGLTKYYGAVVGVEQLSFQVERGEVYGFLGANGAGKTTTMRLLLDSAAADQRSGLGARRRLSPREPGRARAHRIPAGRASGLSGSHGRPLP